MIHINKTTATVKSIKFLGLTIDTMLNLKHHISDLKPRLNKACYAIRSIKPLLVCTFYYVLWTHFLGKFN